MEESLYPRVLFTSQREVFSEPLVTGEQAGKRGGKASEEPDRAGIFSAVFAVSLRYVQSHL